MQELPRNRSLLTPEPVRRIDDVGLDGQVVVNELRRIGRVGQDAADFCRSQEDVVRTVLLEPGSHGRLLAQVEGLEVGP